MFASYGMTKKRLSVRLLWCVLGCGLLSSVALGSASAQARRRAVPVTVMSYNIFQGTELSHSLTATTFSQLQTAVAADYRNVIRSKIPARAKALAAEIKRNSPVVVGLQEAVLWRTRSPAGPKSVAVPGDATHVSFDFVKLLVRALAARGAHYHAAAIINNFDAQATGDFGGGKKMDIRITDRVAILARNGVRISNAQAHNFVAHDNVNLVGVPIAVKDGWTSVDVKVRGRRFRFITTHLDGLTRASANSVRSAETSEIINGPANTKMPVILSCDCNTTPGGPAYRELRRAKLRDSWRKVHPHLRGLTCCHRRHRHDPEVDVADPRPRQGIVKRLDYIWSRSLKVLAMATIGLDRADRTHTRPRLWPSDHLGLVALLALP
jgi:hypothetical protein